MTMHEEARGFDIELFAHSYPGNIDATRHEPIPVVGRWLGRVVRGYFNYYAVPGNMYRLASFHSELCRAWRHALIRRSQRYKLLWSRFNRLVKKYLPPCRVVHPLPSERFCVKTYGRSRMQ